MVWVLFCLATTPSVRQWRAEASSMTTFEGCKTVPAGGPRDEAFEAEGVTFA